MISKKCYNELKKKYLIIYKEESFFSVQSPNNVKVIGNTLKKNITKIKLNYFWNQSFDKNRLKIFVFWCFQNYGQSQTIKVLEILKNLGFQYATKAGLSLSIDDLIIPPTKSKLLIDAELITRTAMTKYKNAQITNLERFQKIIETWHLTSEKIKDDMIHHFKTTNIFNPLYMMAFSGARGNVSQVRQLVGMRGLMANPQGQILDFPIRSNFREGLTLTEYVISCYGARKGVVDTALRTANAGYLTRRLVDVAQHIIISNFDCGTNRGILVSEMKQGNKSLFSLRHRLLGRVLAKNLFSGTLLIARKNEEISENLSEIISSFLKTVLIRSPLTCQTTQFICQRCYGWSLAEGKLVSVGEIVGILAAQSIGEPGTQLTMRTFHTGGVFAGELMDQLIAPFAGKVNYNIYIPGNMIRTPQGSIAFLTRIESKLVLENFSGDQKSEQYKLPPYTILFIRNQETVSQNQLLAQFCTFSPSLKNSGNSLIEYKIYSDLEGEIKSTDLKILKKITEMNDIMHRSLQWGYIWILSGKIYQLPFNSMDGLQIKSSGKKNFFPIQGDLLTKSSILSTLLWINNNENVKLTFQEETNFYKKFTNTKKLYLIHYKQLNLQWLQKWKIFSDKHRLTNLDNAIKKFSKNLELLSEESIIKVQSENLLLFLIIDKIRYKDFAYFLIIKKKLKKTSIIMGNQTKQDAKKQPNHSFICRDFLHETNQLKKKTKQGKNLDNENKIFLSIPLEYNKNQSTTVITQPKFFYQKQSNLFVEWFSNESHFVQSGLLNFSEIFLYQNQEFIKKEKRKKDDIISILPHLTGKKIINVKKLQQHSKLTNEIKDYLFMIQNNFLYLYSFSKKKQIEYLNSYYSKIIFSFHPFKESQKQFLSELKFFKNTNYIEYVNSIKKLNFLQSIYFLFGKKTKRLNSRNKYKDYKKCYDLKKQIFNYISLKKSHKFQSNKYIRFKIDEIKKENDNLFQQNVVKNSELLKFKDYKITNKNVILQKKKQTLLLNKFNYFKKFYISIKPISFFYKQFNNGNLLRKKIFYTNLQLKMLFKHKQVFSSYHQNKQHHKFFMFLSKDFLTKNLFVDFYQYIENKSKLFKNYSIFQKFSNIFINFNALEIKSRKNDFFCQDFIFTKFYYLDLKTIQNKKKFAIFKNYHKSNNIKKFEEIKNIQNLKKFYSSFTYYIIKNQFRFDSSFQAQSINQLENIYKKEVINISKFNSYTQKLLLIKSLNKNFFSSFLTIKKNQTNCFFKNKKLISIHNAYQKLSTTYDFPKLLKKMKKVKQDLKNQKSSQSMINDLNSLKYLFQSIIMFSNFMFHKKNNIYEHQFFDFKHKNKEKKIFNSLIGVIDYKKYSPMLLIKYKKNKIHINGFVFPKISIFKHLFLRQQSIHLNKKVNILINNEEGLINNQVNKFILKMYLIKLYATKNIVINDYFELVSFKWLGLETKSVLEKTKILNPIFFKRLYFSKFINKNIILSEEKSKTEKTNIDLEKTNKQKRFNKYSRNDYPTLKKKNEKFLLYTRFSLVSQDYIKTFKKYLSMIIFNTPHKNFNKTLKVLLKPKNNISLFYQSNILSLFQLQEYYFPLKTDKKFFKFKKKIKLSTLKNFLNLKKNYDKKTKNILSKKSYLQKINILSFHLFEVCYNKKFDIFETTRQFQYRPLLFNDSYGILRFEKNRKQFSMSRLSKLSRDKNIFSLYKKSLRILKNKWQLFKNKTDILITNEPSWICKPIKKSISIFLFNEYKPQLQDYLYCLFVLLGKKLKIFNSIFRKDVHSIQISYKYCQKKLNWLNFTFLEMIEWFEKFHKFYFQKKKKSTFDSLFFFENKMQFIKRKFLSSLKTQIKNHKKNTGYYWFINKKARFIIMNQSNNCNINLKENCQTKTLKQHKNIDKFFCIIKVKEFFINNYQNLSYLSNTNLLFSSKKKLFNNIKQKNRDNFSCNNNGLILKFQYNSIFLNKQKVSKKLISKLPNLELTIEQHLNIPSKNLNNSLQNNSKIRLKKQPVLFSKNRREYHYFLKYKKIQTMNLENNNKMLNKTYLNERKIKRFKFRKPIRIFRHFLLSFLPINFDFSFQSSAISWNFFPNSYLTNLKFEKNLNMTHFIIYLIYKNQRLNKLDVKINKNACLLYNIKNFAMLINFSCALNTLLRQPCIDWSASQSITIGYKKNNFLAPTKTVLLLSKNNYLNNNYPIALTKFYSGLKGEILYSLETKKQQLKKTSVNEIDLIINENSLFPESVLKSQSSLFLTTSDQISFKFKNDKILSNQLNFGGKIKFNIFQNQRHIRSLKIFQIKSVKQIKLIFQILRKIHNRCQFTNQSIKLNLGLFVFQGDVLTTCFKTSPLYANGTKINHIQSIIINHSGQIVHLNKKKITLRKGQPVFFSPNCIFHSYNSDFIQQNKPVLSLPYQQLKTGDIVQGIPKIEQLFEARLSFGGKLEFDNLTNILNILFQTYKKKLQWKLAVRRSIELIQMIIINSIQRIYRSQGVNISDKHLEVIIKQMTKKVEIIDSAQSGFLIGEHFDLDVIELWNAKLPKIKHVKYKPLILGISKASLQTDSFLSAASFQYTTRILSQAAFFKKRDFLKGLKENIIVGNIIPAGTGYLGNIEDLFKTN